MADKLNTTQQGKPVAPQIVEKALSLVAKAKYEAPKVISFSLDGMSLSEPMALSGNV